MARTELQIIDGANKYNYAVAPAETGKMAEVESVDWEPADGKIPWRSPLHPWKTGINSSRIKPRITFSGDLKNLPSMTYAKSNGDASNPNYFTGSPKYNVNAPTLTSVFFNQVNELYYDASSFGTTSYMGPSSQASAIFLGIRNFNGKAYFGGGQYLYSFSPTYTLTIIKDFGAGKTVLDIEIFNNELIIAMGETENIWKMDAAEVFTQSAQGVYASSFGRVEDKLWRSRAKNLLSNCIINPLLLASWVPVAGSEYVCGDSTYAVTDLVEYGGTIIAVRPDGVFFPDNETKFHNQTPQLAVYPNSTNGIGSFLAKGALFIPSVAGLLQVSIGSSIRVGPELSHRPDFRFHVHGGVEWNGAIYVICHDAAAVEETFICKMEIDTEGLTSNPFIYHEWLRLGVVDSKVIIVFTEPVNPTMVIGYGTSIAYWKMGRGAGLDVDDSLYEFNTTFSIEPGEMVPITDLGIKIDLIGVKLIGRQILGATIKVQYDIDRTNIYKDMQSNQDGSGLINVNTAGVFSDTRYAPPNTSGHSLRMKISGTMPAGTLGTNRSELWEAWAFGDAIPESTDVITLGIYANRDARVRGLRQGQSAGDIYEQLNSWANTGRILEMRIPDYYEKSTVRVRIVEMSSKNVEVSNANKSQVNSNIIKLVLRRVDFSGDFLAH